MSCPPEERIALYAGGEIDRGLESHLAACIRCFELFRRLEADRDLLASEPPELGAVDFGAMRREILRRTRRRVWPVVLAAAAMVGAAAAGWVWRVMDREIPPPAVVAHVPDSGPPLAYARGSVTDARRKRSRDRKGAVAFDIPRDAFRVPTKDPDVVIIWFTEKGEPQ
jgi:anti-sigma factor RsiW